MTGFSFGVIALNLAVALIALYVSRPALDPDCEHLEAKWYCSQGKKGKRDVDSARLKSILTDLKVVPGMTQSEWGCAVVYFDFMGNADEYLMYSVEQEPVKDATVCQTRDDAKFYGVYDKELESL